jgi:hypothetical protein
MYQKKKTKVMEPMVFNNHEVGIHQCYNQHQVQKDVDNEKKVTMKQVFGVNKPKVSSAKPKKTKK